MGGDDNHTKEDDDDDDNFNKSPDNIESKDERFTDRFFRKETRKKDEFIDDDQHRGLQHPREPKPMKAKSILKSLGPGVITGASDDDPSG